MILQLDKRQYGERPLTNQQIASLLEEIAARLDAQHANPFRVRAYRLASATLRRAERPVTEILRDEGVNGLVRLPGIGHSLALAIEQLAYTGELALLSRLRGDVAPERLLATVPGIGPGLARQIHERLGIESLADLETAAYDGRLSALQGMGRKRIRAVRESLAGRFRRWPRIPESRRRPPRADKPPVEELLDIDAEYRGKAAANLLTRIAPSRFNPERKAWLPILHTQRGERHYTALFSNTARAHEMGATRDWVVIYRDDQEGDGQWTIVTGRFGQLKLHRIVRGRENECKDLYLRRESS